MSITVSGSSVATLGGSGAASAILAREVIAALGSAANSITASENESLVALTPNESEAAPGSTPTREGEAVPADEGIVLLSLIGESSPSGEPGGDVGPATLFSRGADLLASCAPFSSGAITRAFDRILEQLGSSESGWPTIAQRSISIPGITGTVVAVAIALVVRERLRSRSQERGEKAEGEDLSPYPILPSRGQRLALEEL